MWPWLLLLALLVFVGDVAARRWPEKQAAPLAATPAKRKKEEAPVLV